MSGNKIELTIQGLNGHTVLLRRFGVRVIHRGNPKVGTVARFDAQCGGVNHSYFKADLDFSDNVTAVGVRGGGVEKVAPVVPLPHSVSEADPEQWILTVTTKSCDCQYVPYIEYSSDGAIATFDLKLGNRPWEITAARPGTPVAYPDGPHGRWVR